MSWFSKGEFKLLEKPEVKPMAFTVRVPDEKTITDFDSIAKTANYTRNELINIVLERFVSEVKVYEVDSNEQRMLEDDFTQLDKLLKLHINKEIKIGLNKDQLGNEKLYYNLMDYTLSFKDKTLSLLFKGLDHDDFVNPLNLSLDNICGIACQECNGIYRIWLYRGENNWRFFLK